jgi:hypothetical protein
MTDETDETYRVEMSLSDAITSLFKRSMGVVV